MLKKAFYKNAKAMVAIATIACILMTNTVPVIAADQKMKVLSIIYPKEHHLKK